MLASVNDMLCADIPAHMFVTCLAIALDPASGAMVFANAGPQPAVHPHADGGGYRELNATGMPLGLMPGMVYDETVDVLAAGEGMLLHSDGLAEAHDAEREMFGFDRLAELVGDVAGRRGAHRPLPVRAEPRSPGRASSRRTTSRSSPSSARAPRSIGGAP